MTFNHFYLEKNIINFIKLVCKEDKYIMNSLFKFSCSKDMSKKKKQLCFTVLFQTT